MTETVYELLYKIRSHLDHAEWRQAGQVVSTLQDKHDIDDEEELQLLIFKAQLFIDRNEPEKAQAIINKLVNDVANWPKSLQLQILHVASQFSASSHDFRLAEIYVTKFHDIYDSISQILKNKSKVYLADIRNVEGLIKKSKNENEEALSLFEEASVEQRRLDRPFKQAISLYNAGRTANQLNFLARAEIFLEEAYRIFSDLNNTIGSLAVSKELMKTYKQLGDIDGHSSFEKISLRLEHQLEIEEIRARENKKSKRLRDENDKMRQELVSLQSQVQSRDEVESQLKQEIKYLKDKLSDFDNLKTIYSKLKDTIQHLEQQVFDQQKLINKQTGMIKSYEQEIRDLRNELEDRSQTERRTIPLVDQDELENLLASSKLIENVYYHLHDIESAKLRILAMQLRISQERCEEAVKQLEEVGVVKVDTWNYSNPMISLFN